VRNSPEAATFMSSDGGGLVGRGEAPATPQRIYQALYRNARFCVRYDRAHTDRRSR
jgi:hypothetical protein